MSDKKQVSVRLDSETVKQLKIIVAKSDTTIQLVMEALLKQYIAKNSDKL